ncbi:hypothetical protein INT47_004550, partial [Mucor saturninus]
MTLETMQPFEQSFTLKQDHDEENRPNCMFAPSPVAESENYLLETFHQYPHGDFRPTFYNPFEIKHRRRTSRAQLKVLEKSFSENPKPSATIRRILAQKLDMTPRGVQIWFQNRRAKAKLLRRKSNVQQQRHHQQLNQQSSDENDDEDYEEEYNSDSNRSMENKSPKDSSTSDLNQSSVLFSQFFANVQNTHELDDHSVFQSFMPTNDINHSHQHARDTMNWSAWQNQQNSISDNVRTVATVAAATAVATSVTPAASHHYDPSIFSLGGARNWLSHENNEEMFHSQSLRRKSCPAPKNTMVMSDMHYNHQHAAYLSPSWSNSMMARNKKYEEPENSSPMPMLNNYKRNFSYDANTANPAMEYYSMQDMNINYASNHQQLTPPLTASCSASTVAGSPISLDNLYNDPVVVPHNNNVYY